MPIHSCRNLLFLFSLCLFLSCNGPESAPVVIQTSFDKNLIPEGIAVSDGKLYLSSLPQRKVAVSNLDGTEVMDLTESGNHGFIMGLGMETYQNRIYVLSSNSTSNPHKSKLFVFDKKNGTFHYNQEGPNDRGYFFNDLAISQKGQLFITDSDNQTLYHKQDDDADILPFLKSDSIVNTNGIAISDDDKFLYLATYKNGIQVVERESRELLGTATRDTTISTFCIDGLKFYKNSLIGIQNGWGDRSKHRIMRYFLSKSGSEITHAEVLLEANEYFDIPTTLDIDHDILYFIANTQLDKFDEPNQRIKTGVEPKPYYLITLPLD